MDLFDSNAGKSIPPEEEASLGSPPERTEPVVPSAADEREATQAFYGREATYVPPKSAQDREAERQRGLGIIRSFLRSIGRRPKDDLFDPPSSPNAQ